MSFRRDVKEQETARFEDVTVLHATDKALKVNIEGEVHWVPKAAIHVDSEVYAKDTEGELVVFEWWAKDRGLL